MFLKKRGIIFTFEAIFSLFVLVTMLAILPLLIHEDTNTLEKLLFLLDASDVIEKKYHEELAFWAERGFNEDVLLAAIEKIQNLKGQRFYISCGNKTIPVNIQCDVDIKIEKVIVTHDGQKIVSFSLCKN
jgi:hypothetical protein